MKEGWEIKTLKEVGKIFSGNSINAKKKKEKYQNINSGTPYIATKDVGFDRSINYDNGISIPQNDIPLFRIAQKNDVLICAEGGSAGRKIGLVDREICFVNKLFALSPNNLTIGKWVYYWYQSDNFRLAFNSELTGIIGGVSKRKFKELSIPLPPLPEQKKIVRFLDRAFADIDAATANIERNLENARELFQSRLEEVFESENSSKQPVNELCKVVNGYSFKSKDFSPGYSVKSVKITNVGVQEFVESTDSYLPDGFEKLYNKVKVHEGDLVLALTRTIISSGLKIAVVPSSYDGALVNQRVAAIIPKRNVIDSEFIYHYFCTRTVYDYVLSNVNTLMQPNLSIKDLKSMLIPVPSLTVQKQKAKLIKEIRRNQHELMNIYTQKLKNLQDLKKSLLQQAFAGELIK